MRHTSSFFATLSVAAVAFSCSPGSPGAPGAPAIPADSYADVAIEEMDETFRLRSVSQGAGALEVELDYHRRLDQTGPRMMELWLRLSDDLRFETATALEATRTAGKDLVVQPREDGLLRVVLYSTSNLEPIDSGRIASLRLTRVSEGPARIGVERRLPVFAPTEANRGLVLPEAVSFARLGGQ